MSREGTTLMARVLYEVKGVTEELAREALRLAAHKLPIKTRIISREDVYEY